MPIPAIAIHRSGPSDRIARGLDTCFKSSGPYYPVTTLGFDLTRVAPPAHRGHKGLRNLYHFARQNAANIGAAAHLGLEFGAHTLDAQLGAWQIRLHRVLQWTVAALVAVFFTTWLTNLLVMTPAAWYGLPTATFLPIRWMETVAGYFRLGLGGGVTLLILLAGLRLLLTMSPRPVIITFRSIVFLALQPVLVMSIGILAVRSIAFAIVVVGLAAMSVLVNGMAGIIPWIIGIGAIVALRTLWARGALRRHAEGLFEVFRYLGEPDYRHRVHETLDRAILRARERSGDDREFILAGQGLGSIIALDSILHSRVWRRTDHVLLITMGSPLRRYFLTLFPRTLFPETMEDVVDLMAGRLHEFRWINIYHRRDILGTDLGLKTFSGLDVSTGNIDSLLPARADYWQSTEARRAIHDGLQRLKDVQPLRVPMKDAAHRLLEPDDVDVAFSMAPRTRSLLRMGAALATFGWMVWWVATGSGLLTSMADVRPELLVEAGVVVDASVTHRRTTVPRERGVTFVDHWRFSFTDPAGNAKQLPARYDASDAFLAIRPPRFDHRAFTRDIRAMCIEDMPARWWRVKGAGEPCAAEGVRLRYLPGDLSLFDLPDYPRQRFGSDPLSSWSETTVVAGVLAPLLLVPVLLGIQLFTMLSGMREADTEARPRPAKAQARVSVRRPAVTGT